MLSRLFLLFIVVPTIELILLIQVGQLIGTIPTIGLIIFTGVLGAFLAKRQGLQVLNRIRTESQSGKLPADSLSDGVFILIAAAVLMTPGVLTDIFGFLCLIPTTRRLMKQLVWSQAKRLIQGGQVFTVSYGFGGNRPQKREEPDNVIILDPDNYSAEDPKTQQLKNKNGKDMNGTF